MLCHPRKSQMRTTRKSWRYPRNRKPGRCAGCGTPIPRGEGCVEIHGMRSVLYC